MDQESEAAAMGGGGGGGMEDLLGDEGGEEGGLEDFETPEGEEEPSEPDTNLLAVPPASRDDKVEKRIGGKRLTTTAKSKGKWHEPRQDLSGRRAMQRQMSADAGSNLASSAKRNTFKGYHELSRLARGIKEDQDSNYKEEERKIFKLNNEVQSLITELETKKDVSEN